MFKLTQVKKVLWPVDVHIPQDGGTVLEKRITVQFEILDDDEYSEIVRKGDLLKRVVTGWGKDLLPEEGSEPVQFTEENKATLLKRSYVRVALMQAYMQAASGQEAATKN